jgi:hypothetical protein
VPQYIDLGLESDPTVLRQNARDWITSQAPDGYVVDPYTDWILGAVARMAVEVVVTTGRVPLSIFRTFGRIVLGVAPLDATAASGSVIVTAVDADGPYTLDAGADFDIGGFAFQNPGAFTIPNGDTTATVPVVAVEPGAAASGLSGDAGLVSPTVLWIESVALAAPTEGGFDGETDEEYVDRLADELPTLSPKAIGLSDFAALARRDAEVDRALAVKGYIPATGGTALTSPNGAATGSVQTNVDGAVTIFLHDADGDPVTSPALTRVVNALGGDDDRIVNVIVSVADPTYTPITVRYAVVVYEGQDLVTATAAVDDALAAYLSKTAWGSRGTIDPTSWIEETVLRRDDLVAVVGRVGAVRHITTLTLAIGAGVQGTANITLAGPAALPGVLDIAGTASLT